MVEIKFYWRHTIYFIRHYTSENIHSRYIKFIYCIIISINYYILKKLNHFLTIIINVCNHNHYNNIYNIFTKYYMYIRNKKISTSFEL